jgi:DNA polymerase/3'-5' exonuclease PolX
MSKGWYHQSYRHSLAARGISTSMYSYSFAPKYSEYYMVKELNNRINKLKGLVLHTDDAFDKELSEIRGDVSNLKNNQYIGEFKKRLDFYVDWRSKVMKEHNEAVSKINDTISKLSAEYIPPPKEFREKLNFEQSQKLNKDYSEAVVKIADEVDEKIAKFSEKNAKLAEEQAAKHLAAMKKVGLKPSEKKKTEEEEQFVSDVAKDIKYGFAAKRVLKKGKIHLTLSGPEVKALANSVRSKLAPFSKKIEIAGSIRRKVKDPVDVDIVLIPKDKARIRSKLESLGKITASGDTMIETKIKGVDVDTYFAESDSFGAQLLTRTGSAGHNIGLRRIAKGQNKLLNQYGLFNKKTGERLAGRTEREIYKELDRPKFRNPEERK